MLDKSLLWELNFSNGVISYLFGTMHLKDEKAFKYADKALVYVDICDWYFAEIDLQEASESFDISNFRMPDGMYISDLISKRRYERMRKYCKSILDFDIKAYDSFMPLVILNRIAETILSKQRQFPLDQYLWMQAVERNKNLGGVESLESQMAVLKRLDMDTQVNILCKSTANLSKYAFELKRLRNAYESQDILKLYNLSRKSLASTKNELVYQRNEFMASRIEALKDQKTFYAVGAAHLAGYHGVLRNLKQKGVKVKAIR